MRPRARPIAPRLASLRSGLTLLRLGVALLSMGLAATACGASARSGNTRSTTLLARRGALPALHRGVSWVGAARSITVLDGWLGLSSAIGNSRDVAPVARVLGVLGVRSLDAAQLARIGVDARRPVGVVGLEQEHETYALFVSVSDAARMAGALDRAARRAKVSLQRTVVGRATLWVPRGSPRYGVVLRGSHLFVVITGGARSVRDRALVSLASVDPASALSRDPAFRRATRGLRGGTDLMWYAATNRDTSAGTQPGAARFVLRSAESLAIGATLDGPVVRLSAWIGAAPGAKRPSLLTSSAAPLVLFGRDGDAVELTAAGHTTPDALLGLLDAWWRDQGAPPVGRVYEKLVGRSIAADWRPLLTGTLTIARTASANGSAHQRQTAPTYHTHLAIGVSDEARAHKLLADLADRVPLLARETRDARTTYWLRTERKRRLRIVVDDGSILVTSGADDAASTSSDNAAIAPLPLQRAARRRKRGALLVADMSFLASLLRPVEPPRTHFIVPIPAPGAPLSEPYKQLIQELRRVHGAMSEALKQIAAARRRRHVAVWGALGQVELVATPVASGTAMAGTLRLRGAPQALIDVALTAAAGANATLLRVQKHVSALTARAGDLRTRARLRRQRDIAEYLLRRQLSQPATRGTTAQPATHP